MKIRSNGKWNMKNRVQRNVLSQKVKKFQSDMCAPPSDNALYKSRNPNERAFLCTLAKGSLTVEAALLLPIFLMILLAFFSFFSQYASAAELKVKAAAEAKKAAILSGSTETPGSEKIMIFQSAKAETLWSHPFWKTEKITEKAVCRAWIGFTETKAEETYVYITLDGEVYHLYRDCTHLKLSVRKTALAAVHQLKNVYGQKYRKCEICEAPFGAMVYITSEGDCYHSERTCSGLKRTVRQVPLSQVGGRSLCSRCGAKEE